MREQNGIWDRLTVTYPRPRFACWSPASASGSCATMVKVFWPELFEVAGDHHMAEHEGRPLVTQHLAEFLAERLGS